MQEFALGTVLLDRYQLTSVLGRGLMGHVWQGCDLRLERPAAVKTPRWTGAAAAAERFRRFRSRRSQAPPLSSPAVGL